MINWLKLKLQSFWISHLSKLKALKFEIVLTYITLTIFFLPYTKIFWPSFLILFLIPFLKVKGSILKHDYLSISFLILFSSFKLIFSPTIQALLFVKTFVGFYFFYFYFRYFYQRNYLNILILLCCFFIFFEFTLNLPSLIEEAIVKFKNRGLLFFLDIAYPRPLGVGENPTITTIIFSLYLYSFHTILERKTKIFLIISILLCGSGMGYFLLVGFFLLTFSNKLLKSWKSLFGFMLFLSISYWIFYHIATDKIYSGNPLYKISPDYILKLVKIKKIDFESAVSKMSFFDLLFGLSWGERHHLGGDFGWVDLIRMIGLIGISIYFYVIHHVLKDILIKLILLVSLFHYNVLWWSAGEIFFGYLCSLKKSKDSKKLINFYEK